MTVRYLDQIDIKDKRVLIRVDFNVPYDKQMHITDDTRITATLPTIEYCLEHQCRIILVSHLGRPKGVVDPHKSLAPVAERLSHILKRPVHFIKDEIGEPARKALAELKHGEIALLENIRFYPGETKNDIELGKNLASLADVYINDAFAAAHRAHSSNESVTKYIPVSAAGFLLKNEIEYFRKALLDPAKPVATIIGGVKISTKIDAILNMLPKVDYILIGGGMAFTFLKAMGYSIGKSVCEDDFIDTALDIMASAQKHGVKIILPSDVIVAPSFDDPSTILTTDISAIPADMQGVDIGDKSVKSFIEVLEKCETVIWNGPVGAFETPEFAGGTFAIAKALAGMKCMSLIGGGDTGAAVNQSGYADCMTYISTGGGAFLELLEGKELPGITALDK